MQLTSIINLQYTYRIWLVGRALSLCDEARLLKPAD